VRVNSAAMCKSAIGKVRIFEAPPAISENSSSKSGEQNRLDQLASR
jgi:hypothetical protein